MHTPAALRRRSAENVGDAQLAVGSGAGRDLRGSRRSLLDQGLEGLVPGHKVRFAVDLRRFVM